MLIVVLVICILISVGFGAYSMAREAAWKEKARDSAKQIAVAWNLRLQEDRQFPPAAAFTSKTLGPNEVSFPSTSTNMNVLNGVNGDGRIYLEQSAEQRLSGMQDRWRRFFNVRLDLNYDGTVRNPIDDSTPIRANVAVWSLGPNPANKEKSWVVVYQ